MNLKKYLDFRILGLVGSIFLIISEFLSWFSELSLLNIYLITTAVALGDSFLYLFPLICGIICLFGTLLVTYNIDYKISSVIINFIGLGFFILTSGDILGTKEFMKILFESIRPSDGKTVKETLDLLESNIIFGARNYGFLKREYCIINGKEVKRNGI